MATTPIERCEVGDKVLYTALFNNPGHERPGDKIPGTVISVFGKPPVYRIELDVAWNERMLYARGKKIIVGNVRERSVSRLKG